MTRSLLALLLAFSALFLAVAYGTCAYDPGERE